MVKSADAISGGRPGARRDSVENYLKRLADLEDIANSFAGVEKSYAIQAGREIRIFVRPEEVTDLEAKKMAQAYLDPLEKNGIDTLILGCTHYPHLSGVIQKIGPQEGLMTKGEIEFILNSNPKFTPSNLL